jgi:hypothetical protein
MYVTSDIHTTTPLTYRAEATIDVGGLREGSVEITESYWGDVGESKAVVEAKATKLAQRSAYQWLDR